MPLIRTPRPTCSALTPPRPPCGPLAPRRVWLKMSWNVVRDCLKPVVLTLAMLFPTTSIIVWWFFRPEMAANIERIMCGVLLAGSGSLGDGCAAYFSDRAVVDILAIDYESRRSDAVSCGETDARNGTENAGAVGLIRLHVFADKAARLSD